MTTRSRRRTLHRTDAELIADSHADPRAFAELFDRHYDRISAFLRRRVDPALADELASETFLQAFGARGRYDARRLDARPWLYGIAANLLRGHRRSEQRRLRAFARAATRPADLTAFDGVEDRLDAAAAAPRIAAALGKLRPSERDVLLLHAWTDLSYEQIADALAIPVGTVRSRLHRARGVLGELLGAGGQAEGEQTDAGRLTPAGEEPR